ncbi:MAG: caa(3)-type oxidase subunit IV [Candidatus Omnitrophota bacterium]|nr:MAG: caa(3)-type oxidase subunit IV [Candidatus Omnitrophota bacterium]
MSDEIKKHERGVFHVAPLPVLIGVWAALMVFTWLTVAITHYDLGDWNLWIAMLIATVKASLVALYFMHLRYDKPFNAVVFIGSLFFVMLFVSFALMDTIEYHPELILDYAPVLHP